MTESTDSRSIPAETQPSRTLKGRSGFAGSSRQTIPLVLEPARKPARIPKRVVVPFPVSQPELEAPDARIQVPKSGVWACVELGFVLVLLASAFTLVFLSVVAAGNI
jgi:hypothetical protein